MARMVAITVFCVSLWVGTPVDPWFTGLVGLGLIGVSFTSELALVGFRSPATWLVVLGILLGEATQQSGLATVVERWATDTIHGLHPLYGALAVTLLAFAPRIGVLDSDAIGNVDVSIVFFLGAIFAIAEGLQQTGFTDLATDTILSGFPRDGSLIVALAFLVVTTLALTFVMEGLAVASVLAPVLVSFIESVGLPLVPVMMTEAIALNTYFFSYQSAVLVAILGLNVVDSIELIRMAAFCSLVTLLVLLPIQILIFAAAF